MKNEQLSGGTSSIRPSVDDWLQGVWERFYVQYAVPAMKQHPEASALSQLQAKIEEQLKNSLTAEHYQLVLDWEDVKNRWHALEVERMYELGVKVGIRIQQEYDQFTKLP